MSTSSGRRKCSARQSLQPLLGILLSEKARRRAVNHRRYGNGAGDQGGPAKYFTLESMRGRVGFRRGQAGNCRVTRMNTNHASLVLAAKTILARVQGTSLLVAHWNVECARSRLCDRSFGVIRQLLGARHHCAARVNLMPKARTEFTPPAPSRAKTMKDASMRLHQGGRRGRARATGSGTSSRRNGR